MKVGVCRAPTVVILVALVCSAAMPSHAVGQPKTEVGIVFELSDPRYTDEFQTAQLTALKQEVGETMVRVFDDRVRFLDFSTNDRATYLLTIRLARAEGSRAEGPSEFGFHFSLTGPDVRQDVHSYLVFRTKDQYSTPIGESQDLLHEIELKLQTTDHGRLVQEVFRHVPITEEAAFSPQPLGWVVSQNRTALCVDRNSRIEVLNAFPLFGSVAHHPFIARVVVVDRPEIVSMADKNVNPEMIEQLMAVDPAQVRVERVFVVDYRRFCPQPVSGDQVDFSGRGGSQ